MTVSPKFAALMPKEFVDDLNIWMLKFFGTHSICVLIHENTLVMGVQLYQEIMVNSFLSLDDLTRKL